jgi:hypothetical protein
MKFCTRAGRKDDLVRSFAALCVAETGAAGPAGPAGAAEHDLAVLLSSLRKLREGIVGSGRADDWAVQAYSFSIRLAILAAAHDSYRPALLYLLGRLQARRPLAPVALAEFGAYAVLDAACREGDVAAAYAARRRWGLRDARIDSVLGALVHGDYERFWRVRRAIDGYRGKLMDWAGERMRRHALVCLARAYLTAELALVERVTGRQWRELVEADGVGWELVGSTVVLRRPKGASRAEAETTKEAAKAEAETAKEGAEAKTTKEAAKAEAATAEA